MIARKLHPIISEKLNKGKAIVIMGARQTGKTTLLKALLEGTDVLWFSGDNPGVQSRFSQADAPLLKALIGEKKFLIIDEAQKIENIGNTLKIIVDQIPEVQVIATGSSSFDLANKTNEPLTGRKFEFTMFPISTDEMVQHHGLYEEETLLNHRLVFGYYPEVLTNMSNEVEILQLLSDSYLYKDVLMLDNIQKPEALVRLLQALAYQIGNQVSYHELSQLIGLDSKTVEKYITLLEKSYIIFRLGTFSRNLRNELKKSRKIYFYDNGIRNAVLSNFQFAETRADIGALWENYLISERKKHNHYQRRFANLWFWRTRTGQEIDYLEEINGTLTAFEFKWNPHKKINPPKTFTNHYPNSTFEVITPKNYMSFVTGLKL
ncbi:MAG: ATP-binding protein [Cryomorphaceae bacterium]|nr:ATP-binding protein [Cryomorphaceae bacterium]